jgi:uncharacterized protein YgfB (UPF0149 family)
VPAITTDYDHLERLLANSPLSGGAAEAHGIYCGLFAAEAPEAEERWLAELLPRASDGQDPAVSHDITERTVSDCRDALATLASETRAQARGPSMSLDPLLPPDDRSLRERAVAVHDWARGFLFGLGLAKVDARALSAQNREVFDDFVELTRMDLNDLDDDQANEEALAEIIEFVRVAALLIYEDRCGRRDH